MERQPDSSRVVRFGSFELDRATGELRKRGVRVKLQEQPFHVLAALLERPGELVTREQLQEKLWPGDTYVEFDQNLNAVVKKVRRALGDSSETPRFIETLPKKGYRFVYPVEGSAVETGGIAPQKKAVGESARTLKPPTCCSIGKTDHRGTSPVTLTKRSGLAVMSGRGKLQDSIRAYRKPRQRSLDGS